MYKLLTKIIRFFFIKIVGKTIIEKLITILAKLINENLLMVAYRNMGIHKFRDQYESGEYFFITNILKPNIKIDKPVFFDIGANNGQYSKILLDVFPDAHFFLFEPNSNTFKVLQNNMDSMNMNINIYNLGLGEKEGKSVIYTYEYDSASAHATLYKEVLIELRGQKNVMELDSKIITLDGFCKKNKIIHIDFIKIDTEGNELNVLKGAGAMLKNKTIDFIQFEFNEMNVYSRTFLKDFYDILTHYDFYRLDSRKIIPLNKYNPFNEIFLFQNIVAVNKCVSILK